MIFTVYGITNPSKSTLLETFVVKNKAVNIPEEYLHPVAAPAEKDEQMPTKRILTEVRLDQS